MVWYEVTWPASRTYGAMRCVALRCVWCYAMCGTEMEYGGTRAGICRPSRRLQCYAVDMGSLVLRQSMVLLFSCGKSGAAIGCSATLFLWNSFAFLWSYWKSGTEAGYGATLLLWEVRPVLRQGMVPLFCYGKSGTEAGYGSTGGDPKRASEAHPRARGLSRTLHVTCTMQARDLCEIKCKTPQSPYSLYWESGAVSLIWPHPRAGDLPHCEIKCQRPQSPCSLYVETALACGVRY
eukprot:3936863-Rhodomonas_salina.1